MTKPGTKKRAGTTGQKVVSGKTTPPAGGPEPRLERRKRETRSRLLQAALELMADKGMEGVAINEITDKADVGFGSFYNHFESKEAIYEAVTNMVFESYADGLERLTDQLTDPAEVLAVSIRHTILRARREPIWGRFLIREGFSSRAMSQGLGQRLFRDISTGIAAKRFKCADPMMCFLAVGGTVLASIAATHHFADQGHTQVEKLAGSHGFSDENLADRAACLALQILGLSVAKASDISRKPLPSAVFSA